MNEGYGNTSQRPVEWEKTELGIYKYVDDFLTCESLWIGDGFRIIQQKKQDINLHALQCQNFFNSIVDRARTFGVTNEKKIQLMCLSSAANLTVSSYIGTREGLKVESQPCLKQFGFHFSSRPSVEEHVTPILDYSSVVFHSLLSEEQTLLL